MNDKTTESLSVSTVTVKIGDIFHTCWGYEQTNIEFYQVVSLHGKKTVGLCKIAGQIVEHTSNCLEDKFLCHKTFTALIEIQAGGFIRL